MAIMITGDRVIDYNRLPQPCSDVKCHKDHVPIFIHIKSGHMIPHDLTYHMLNLLTTTNWYCCRQFMN